MSKKYYEGGMRIVKNGVPWRVAAWMKDLKWARSVLDRGEQTYEETKELRRQLDLLATKP